MFERLNRPYAKMQAFRNMIAAIIPVFLVLIATQVRAQQTPELVRFQSMSPDRAELTARLHLPRTSQPAPAVVLMHGCGGWQPEVLAALEHYALFLVRSGYVVLNLDSFGSRNRVGGRVCGSLGELTRARSYRTYDAFTALDFLRRQPFIDSQNIFLVGQSNGGSVALISALTKTTDRFGGNGFRGIVALYPWCGAAGGTRLDLHSPLLVLGGAMDDWVPPHKCQRFKARGQELTVMVYENAAHSYDLRIPMQRYLGNLVGYNPKAAADTRTQMLAFFQRQQADQRLVMR